MKILQVTEEQMTFLLKQFLNQYKGQFDHVTFDEAPGGYLVHFHQMPEPKAQEPQEEPYKPATSGTLDYEPPIGVFNVFGPGVGFGGFGGGSSGGGGASGTW